MRLNRKMRIGAASLAIALFLLGLFSVVRRLNQSSAAPIANAPAATDNRPVVVAVATQRVAFVREALPARSIVTLDMLEMRDSATSAETNAEGDGFVTDPETQAVGFITQRALSPRTALRLSDLVGHISEVGIAGALQPGTRAMMVPISGKSTLHDLVRIGDRVDVLASFDQQEARTVVGNVRVLAVDVFGKDFPSVKIAMRGDYKAPARSIGSANPASPAGGTARSNPDAPGAAPPPAANPNPTPTPTSPNTRPDPALTLEVTPQQAATIALTQASGQNLDFLIRPRNEPTIVAGAIGSEGGGVSIETGNGSLQLASATRDRLAPYANRIKNQGGASSSARTGTRAATANGGSPASTRRSTRNRDFSPLPMPEIPAPVAGMRIAPLSPADLPVRASGAANRGSRASIAASAPPATYDIPVIADGRVVRVETVKKPQE